VSPRGLDGIYDILNHLTGQSLFTHQLVRAAKVAAPVLLERFPLLAQIEKPVFLFPDDMTPEARSAAVAAWVAEQVQFYGEQLEIESLSVGIYEPQHPLDELSRMMGLPSKE